MDVASSRTSSSSRSQSGVSTQDRACDISQIVKKCNEVDLNLIVIWKVHARLHASHVVSDHITSL